MDILSPYNLILGSASPRRRQILEESGIPFTLRVKAIEEFFSKDMQMSAIAEFLAVQKAKAHHESISNNEILLTADSIVVCNGCVMGKPKDRLEAIEMLETLSNNTHEVYTGVSLWTRLINTSFTARSIVRFLPLSTQEIDYYVGTYHPYDKAGAYGIQEWIGHNKIEWIEGSYLNIMGLPMHRVYAELSKLVEDLKNHSG